jgi:hypothetical protein
MIFKSRFPLGLILLPSMLTTGRTIREWVLTPELIVSHVA